ncbi:MAG: glucose/mannose transport system substrate-binding protein [Thermoleophilaceae bacterium]|jgi:glucose/mannose transport system substrate-binding protein|nr:glucose/mannose transport system substrate-binding protein [Thermoleophilaceae bacterium]MEA2623020.1 glucose/mannose transport system substrate-binding protein [Chloroflexota bacterium]
MQRVRNMRVGAMLGMLALVLAACGATATQKPAASGTPAGPAATGTAAPQATGTPVAGACQTDTTKTAIEVDSWWTTGGEANGFNKLLDTFNAANPSLCAYNAAIAGGAGTVAQGRIKAAVLAGLPPDSFQVHMGHELLDTYVNLDGGSLMSPLDDIVDASKFPAGVIQIVSGTDGHIYTVPLNIHRANELWYNKSVFEANGITAPTTWDEFKTAADKLKAANITPIAVGDTGIWASGMIFETVLIGELGPDGFNALWTDAAAWSDAKVLAAFDTYKMVLGYQNADHSSLSWDQANQLVIDGKAGMTIMGDWANGDYVAKNFTGYGWAPAPGNTNVYQALADSFPLPVKATHPEETKKLLTFMASAEGQDIFNPYKGSIPARIDSGKAPAGGLDYNEYQKSAMKEWVASTTKVVPSMEHGAAANPAFASAINDALTAFVADGNSQAAQAAIAAAAAQYVTK